MAKRVYNTFVVINCKSRAVELVTSSAKKAAKMLCVGRRVDVWNCNEIVERIHAKEKEKNPMGPYIMAEREYIRQKQNRAEEENKRRYTNECQFKGRKSDW